MKSLTPRIASSRVRAGSLVGVAALLAMLSLPACGGPVVDDLGLDVDVGISPTPPVVAPTRVVISIIDTTGRPTLGATVRLEGNTSHAGTPPVFGEAEEVGEGQYVVPSFGFTLAGDWVLTVHITLADGRSTTREHPTDVVSTPAGFDTLTGRS